MSIDGGGKRDNADEYEQARYLCLHIPPKRIGSFRGSALNPQKNKHLHDRRSHGEVGLVFLGAPLGPLHVEH